MTSLCTSTASQNQLRDNEMSFNPNASHSRARASHCIGIALIITAIHLFATLPSFADESNLGKRQSITVVMDDQYPPYIFRDEEGHLQGILKDTWDLWSKKTGIAVKLEAMDWGKAQQFMLAGNADVIDSIFLTEARSHLYDFSKPSATLEVPIFFHKSIEGISDAHSLQGFTVGVKDGDACIEWLTEHGIANFKKYPSYEAI